MGSAKRLLADVVDLPAPEQRAYIEGHCNDPTLRRELLAILDSPSMVSQAIGAVMLATGMRIGVYEIVELIGTGGMGEVYRARDTSLGRDVALKVLPSAFASDPDLLARLEREARLLASLNHPNIAQIHGLEASNGTRALVMELVEGETLADRIARRAIPLQEVLPIARQISEALEAAHERGIIHRDLKPANIKVRSDGTVKVLDFGLAKAIDPNEPAIQNSPTMTATARGVILGTAAYMSPEQATGSFIDKRSDLWALGVVLLEMLTGRRPFAGETVSEVVASVLKDHPDYSRLPSDTPPSIRRLLQRCLEKDRKRRIADAADARLDIEEALTSSADTWASTPYPRLTVGWFSIGVASILVGLFAVFVTTRQRRTTDAPPVMRVDISMPTIPTAFAMSPDGRYLAFVGSTNGPNQLWLRPLDKTEAHPLAGTEEANHPFWSPDSRSIGFFAAGKLRRVDIDGGGLQEIAEAAPYGGSWNADGTILFVSTPQSPLSRVSASGGQPITVTRLSPPRQTTHRWPHFLPDGRHYLYFINGAADAKGLYLGSLDGDEPKRLTTNQWAGEYLPPGFVLTVRQGALVAQKLDLTRGELTGDLITLAYPIDYVSGFFEGFSVASNGLVAYRTSGGRRQLTWFDRHGRAVGVAVEPDATFIDYPELSPDDRMIAVERGAPNADIWWMNTVGGSWNRLTFGAANHLYPLWSRDGSRLLFSSNSKGVSDLYWKPSNGAEADEILLETPNAKVAQDWSKDGRYLLYSENDPRTGSDLWVLDTTGSERRPRAFVNGPADELMGTFSPDGRWVAYETNESGRSEIMVASFPNPTGRWLASAGGGRQPRWRADGSELYFIAPDGKLMAEPVSGLGAAFEVRPATPLFQVPIQTSSAAPHKPQYAVACDGRFLINQPAQEGTIAPITLLMNWTSTLPK